jgi:hypothetical protein
MVSLLLPLVDGHFVSGGLSDGLRARLSGPDLFGGITGRLPVSLALCGPVRAIRTEGEEQGQHTDHGPAARGQEAGDAAGEGEKLDHAKSLRSHPIASSAANT